MLDIVVPPEEVVELEFKFIGHNDEYLVDSGEEGEVSDIDVACSVEGSAGQMLVQLFKEDIILDQEDLFESLRDLCFVIIILILLTI